MRRRVKPSHGLFSFDWHQLAKIHLHRLKECLKVIEVAKFESDLLKTNRDIAQQRCRILQTFVIEGVGTSSCFPTLQMSVKFCSFVESYFCWLWTDYKF